MRILRNMKLLLWFLVIDSVRCLKTGPKPQIQKTPIIQTNLNVLIAIKPGIQKVLCFELIGYSNWWDPTRHRNSKRPSTTTIAQTKENDIPLMSSALLTTTNTGGKTFNTSTPVLNSAWIIDSGAIDHMTFDVRQVTNPNPSFQHCVSITNGNTAPVVGEGSSHLTNSLQLNFVLVVPSVDYITLY